MKELFVPKEAFDQKPKEDGACQHAKHPGYDGGYVNFDATERYSFHDLYCHNISCSDCICYRVNKDEYKRRYRLKRLKEIKDEKTIHS